MAMDHGSWVTKDDPFPSLSGSIGQWVMDQMGQQIGTGHMGHESVLESH